MINKKGSDEEVRAIFAIMQLLDEHEKSLSKKVLWKGILFGIFAGFFVTMLGFVIAMAL